MLLVRIFTLAAGKKLGASDNPRRLGTLDGDVHEHGQNPVQLLWEMGTCTNPMLEMEKGDKTRK